MTYKSKLLVNFMALFAVFTLLLVMFQYNREKQYKRELLETRLRSYANVVAGAVNMAHAVNDSTSFDALDRMLPSDLRLTVIGHRGNVIYESRSHGILEMGNHLDRPEVAMAEESREGEGVNIRCSATFHKDYFYFAKDYHGFIVRVALPFNAEVQNFMKADNVFLWFVLMLFPIALVLLIYISDRFGKAVSGLRNFMNSADRGLVDYERITFPQSELGKLGEKIMQKYKQLEDSSRQIALERERLLRHFHYFEEGIGIFDAKRRNLYTNPRFTQYINVILEHPTGNVDTLWKAQAFAPVAEFLDLHSKQDTAQNDTPVFRYTLKAGGSTFGVQVLVYSDGSFELSLADVTKAEKNREDLHAGLESQHMTLHVNLPEGLTLNGNYSLIYSIFRNLVENSIRYAGEGTEVNISCYNMTQEFCYFSVYDTGQGVAEEHLPRLFERFYRVTEGRTRANGGTGLGLSIVRNAVLFHHGDISVRNRKGAGLEFIFTLHR